MAGQLPTDWRSLAEQTSNEMNSAKLATLVAELCRALDSEHIERYRSQRFGRVIPVGSEN